MHINCPDCLVLFTQVIQTISILIFSKPFSERTKHIEVSCHFIQENIQQGLVYNGHHQRTNHTFKMALNGCRVDYLFNKLYTINIHDPT